VRRALPQWLLWLACGLACVIVGTSSGLRLAANGLGCEPWPRCYGTAAAAQQAQLSAAAKAARLSHRIAASGFAAVALIAVVLGWRRWTRPARSAGALLLVLTALLATIGAVTPSPLPAVTLTNLLGGLALLGITAYLLAAQAGPDAAAGAASRMIAVALLLLLALQAAAGTMISVRGGGAACEGGCAAVWPAGSALLWHPLQAGSAEALLHDPRAGAALHIVHRIGAVLLVVGAVLLAARLRARVPGRALALGALALCVLLGLLLTASAGSLSLAVGHTLAAGLLTASLAALLARLPGARGSP
jgi:cytochrome c oxidase assembly protein subunit 15